MCHLNISSLFSPTQSKHEVIFQGSMHRLCSEVCFTRFRSTNKLSMNSCQSCNNYCYGKVTVLVMQGVNKTFCSAGCVTTFKQVRMSSLRCRSRSQKKLLDCN